VGDEDHGSFIGIQGLGDDRQVAEIDMVGRLVEDEEARALEDETGKCHQPLLPLGERSDAGMDSIGTDQE